MKEYSSHQEAGRASGQRSAALDVLKVTLAIMVVGLHARLLEDYKPELGYVLVNGVFRIAVPLFLLINGYYFHDTLRSGSVLRWLVRVVSLYAFWMIAYSPFWAIPQGGSPFSVAQFVQRLVFGYHHLWYLAGMAGGAIFIYMVRNASLYLQGCLALLLFIVGVGIQYAGVHDLSSGLIDRLLDAKWSHRNALLFAYPFMFLGLAIRTTMLDRKLSAIRIALAVAAGLLLLVVESMVNFESNAVGFDNLASLALVCPAIFVAALKLGGDRDTRWLAKLSSGIFFVHPFFLVLLSGQASCQAFLGALSLSVIASYFLIRWSKKFPFVL